MKKGRSSTWMTGVSKILKRLGINVEVKLENDIIEDEEDKE
jgi:hypothetical protein